MTVRNTKRLILVLIGLMVLVGAVEVIVAILRPESPRNYFRMSMPFFMSVLFVSTLQRLSKLEAEHGPDYIEPTSPHARKILIGVAIVAVILGGITAYLIATH